MSNADCATDQRRILTLGRHRVEVSTDWAVVQCGHSSIAKVEAFAAERVRDESSRFVVTVYWVGWLRIRTQVNVRDHVHQSLLDYFNLLIIDYLIMITNY